MSTIITRSESERGCGYRKEKGIYLVAGAMSLPCDKMPIPLESCPCCGAGIKATRGYQWVSSALIEAKECPTCGPGKGCIPFDGSVKRFGLLWVGGSFYKRPADFTREASLQGISRRISTVPKELVVGETWVLLGHRECIALPAVSCMECEGLGAITVQGVDKLCLACEGRGKVTPFQAGLFAAFRPTAIEYIVKGDESEEELLALEKRGLTLINVLKRSLPTSTLVDEEDI